MGLEASQEAAKEEPVKSKTPKHVTNQYFIFPPQKQHAKIVSVKPPNKNAIKEQFIKTDKVRVSDLQRTKEKQFRGSDMNTSQLSLLLQPARPFSRSPVRQNRPFSGGGDPFRASFDH